MGSANNNTKEYALVGIATRGLKVIVMTILLSSLSTNANQLRKHNLRQLIEQSHIIIYGTVKSVTDGVTTKGIPFTEVVFDIKRSAKNRVRSSTEYIYRQFGFTGLKTQTPSTTLMTIAEGVPRWNKGEVVVAFLYKANAKTGLQATVGLEQGKLSVYEGKLIGRDDSDSLFSQVNIDRSLLTPQEFKMIHSDKAIEVDDFMGLIERAVTEQWIESGGMH
ncbi:hypothetical protein [Kangiella geojedonensis]|uniref:Uncharacterized protein n=1 Tax=Kangiella geojedonensis TaxID=914150 RepID=A0A0F6TQH4_9GAMM|nr:hypothetical protein [Kangiella geojedonensis]AKE51742.1 hypothetical protein TQ33_0768 [Kangiella geojedonensis]